MLSPLPTLSWFCTYSPKRTSSRAPDESADDAAGLTTAFHNERDQARAARHPTAGRDVRAVRDMDNAGTMCVRRRSRDESAPTSPPPMLATRYAAPERARARPLPPPRERARARPLKADA